MINVIITICLLAVLQYAVGNFPVARFAFPLNLLAIILWLLALWFIYKHYRHTSFCRYLLSLRATVITIVLLLLFCLVLGLVPQYPVDPFVRQLTLSERLGLHQITTSWSFLFVLLLLQTQLVLITFRGIYDRAKRIRWRFITSHFGLWLTLVGGFWGSADTTVYRIPVYQHKATNIAYAPDGGVRYLPQQLQLTCFDIAYYDNGMPRTYEAHVAINGREVTLCVNKPYALTFGEDLYLTEYDREHRGEVRYCVLQLVKQPWKYLQLSGILMLLFSAVLLFIKGPQKKIRYDNQLG